jgi:hypothetical protein
MATAAVVDVSVDSTTVVSAGPALLKGVIINTALSAHALPIKSGSDTLVTLPASAAAGAHYIYGEGVLFPSSLIVDPDNSATGNITVLWSAAR